MIKLVVVGRIKEKSLKSLIDDYVARISFFHKINVIEINDEPIKKKSNEALDNQVKVIEGKNILKNISDDEFVYLLDLHGKAFDSISLARHVDNSFNSNSKITFVIGGSLGLSDEVVGRANIRWKLSECTFPHQIVRLLLVEQIYRFFAINNGLPYHK